MNNTQHRTAPQRGIIIFALTTATALLMSQSVLAHDFHGAEKSGEPLTEVSDKTPSKTSLMSAEGAFFDDVKLLAKHYGWPLDLTEKHVRSADAFTELVADIVSDFPASYSSAAIAALPGLPSTIWFKGRAPLNAVAQIKRSGLDVKVEQGQRYSRLEQERRVNAISKSVLEQGFQEASVELLPGGQIEVIVALNEKRQDKLELARDLTEGVEVEYSKPPLVQLDHARGGARVRTGSCTQNNVGNGICTSGFSVIDSRGRTGVTIAGHCDGFTNYIDPVGPDFCMSHVREHMGSNGDIEWKTTNHIEPAEFFAREDELRTVRSVSGLLLWGRSTCLYGRTSNNRTCTSIRSPFASFVLGGVLVSGLATTNSTVSLGGDSGGPWSFASRADASNTGRSFTSSGTRGIISPAFRFNAAIGVTVRTAP